MNNGLSFRGRMLGLAMLMCAGLCVSLGTAVMLGAAARPEAAAELALPELAPPEADGAAKGGKGAARYAAGAALVEKGEFAKALKEFEEARRLERSDADILAMQALCLRKLGRFEEAREGYHAALKVRAKFPEARENLGETYLQLAKEQLEILSAYGADGKAEAAQLSEAIKALAAEVSKGK